MPTRDSSNAKRIEALERRLASLERQLASRESQVTQRTRIRLAKTLTSETPGNVQPIVFVDAEYATTEGDQELTVTEHAETAQGVARTLSDGVVAVLEHQGVKRRLFLLGGGGGAIVMAILAEDLCPGDRCATVRCIVGTTEEITAACNPLRWAANEGDIVFLVPISLVGAYNPDCPDEGDVPEGCANAEDDPVCLPCDEGDIDPEEACDSSNEAGDARWAILAVQQKQVCLTQTLENRDDCLVQGRVTINTNVCSLHVCGEVVTELEPVSEPAGCEEVDLTFADAETGECCQDFCCGDPPEELLATFTFVSATSGDCDALTGQAIVLAQDGPGRWTGAAELPCGTTWSLTLYCDREEGPPTSCSDYALEWAHDDNSPQGSGTIVQPEECTCEPFYLRFRNSQVETDETNCCDNVTSGIVDIEITENV